MKVSGIRYVFCASMSTAMLAGCGGSQPPVGAPGAMLQVPALATQAGRGTSWMLPEARSEDLLYAPDVDIGVCAYPSGTPVGTIAGFYANGICSDKSGNVFAVDRAYAQVDEFPHGSLTPSAILHLNQPLYCAVDPNTGNLAVVVGSHGRYAAVAIFTAEKGRPKYYDYSNYNARFWNCAYDSHSNLVVAVSLGNSLLAELPKGGSKFQNLKLKGSGGFSMPNPVQWDGKYLTVGNQSGSSTFTIYRLKLTGTSLSIVGRSILNAYGVGSTWFEPGTLIGTSVSGVSLWKYPAGGYPFLTLQDTSGVSGVTISLAPN